MTPNRFDGRDSTRWWNDLPPRIRARFTPVTELASDDPERWEADPPPAIDSRLLQTARRLGVLFLFVLATNIMVILLLVLGADISLSTPTETPPNP